MALVHARTISPLLSADLKPWPDTKATSTLSSILPHLSGFTPAGDARASAKDRNSTLRCHDACRLSRFMSRRTPITSTATSSTTILRNIGSKYLVHRHYNVIQIGP